MYLSKTSDLGALSEARKVQKCNAKLGVKIVLKFANNLDIMLDFAF